MDTPLIAATIAFVKQCMSTYDSSHDYRHIERVLSLSRQILAAPDTPESCDPNIVTLLALLHDVGDKKYSSKAEATSASPLGPVETFLLSAGAAPPLAQLLQMLVRNVSYSHERANPSAVAETVERHPELAVVQDADRLDAIGAVGVGRAFTYAAARADGDGGGMGGVIGHFDEKLVGLERTMKTAEGRRLARIRGERIRAFREWWREEVGE